MSEQEPERGTIVYERGGSHMVLALGIAAFLNVPIPETHFGSFRM